METKNTKRLSCKESFNIKSNSPARSLTVEGFANKAIVDRGGDLIPPSAWELSEFKNNNILLFNHNQDIAIGLADVKVTEQGLFAKAKISKSNEAPIPYIRDMIKEGIIKSFSVGFDHKGSDSKSEDGSHTILNKANLLELSVVTVPMNQESTFSVANEVDKCISKWKTKSYHEARNDMLLFKGAYLARAIHDRIAQLQEENTDFDKEEIIDRILSESGASEKTFDDVLAGNSAKIPDTLLNAIANNLDIDAEQLRPLNTGIDTVERGIGEEETPIDEVKKEEEPIVEEEKKEEEKASPMQQCVTAKIPVLIAEGMSQDQAIAVAISHCEQQNGKSCEISKMDFKSFIDLADKIISETKQQNAPTVNLDATSQEIQNAETSNPSMDQFKAQTMLLAQQLGLLETLVNEIRGLRNDLQNEMQISETPVPPAPPAPSPQEQSNANIDAKAARMAEYLKKLSEIEKLIN